MKRESPQMNAIFYILLYFNGDYPRANQANDIM